jgi:hypothetical protein
MIVLYFDVDVFSVIIVSIDLILKVQPAFYLYFEWSGAFLVVSIVVIVSTGSTTLYIFVLFYHMKV